MRGAVLSKVYICSGISCHELSTRLVAGQSTFLPITRKAVSFILCSSY